MDVQKVKEIEVVEEPKKVSKLTKVKNFVTANLVEICGAAVAVASVGTSVVMARNSNKVAKSQVRKNEAAEYASKAMGLESEINARKEAFNFQKEYGEDATQAVLGITHPEEVMNLAGK